MIAPTTNLIWLPGNIPSSKNSKVNGRFMSSTVKKWLRLFGIVSYSARRKEVIYFKKILPVYDINHILSPLKEHTDYPLHLGFHFVRGSKHDWDFHNACQVILDLATALDMIPDDCVKYVLPTPLKIEDKYYSLDKNNPGVFISIGYDNNNGNP